MLITWLHELSGSQSLTANNLATKKGSEIRTDQRRRRGTSLPSPKGWVKRSLEYPSAVGAIQFVATTALRCTPPVLRNIRHRKSRHLKYTLNHPETPMTRPSR